MFVGVCMDVRMLSFRNSVVSVRITYPVGKDPVILR